MYLCLWSCSHAHFIGIHNVDKAIYAHGRTRVDRPMPRMVQPSFVTKHRETCGTSQSGIDRSAGSGTTTTGTCFFSGRWLSKITYKPNFCPMITCSSADGLSKLQGGWQRLHSSFWKLCRHQAAASHTNGLLGPSGVGFINDYMSSILFI